MNNSTHNILHDKGMEYKEKMIEKIENQRIIPFPSTNQCWKPNCDQDVVA